MKPWGYKNLPERREKRGIWGTESQGIPAFKVHGDEEAVTHTGHWEKVGTEGNQCSV